MIDLPEKLKENRLKYPYKIAKKTHDDGNIRYFRIFGLSKYFPIGADFRLGYGRIERIKNGLIYYNFSYTKQNIV